jgi:GT2 family glycosyltransferase
MLSRRENPLISIVIVNYNGLEYLRRCISSLLQSHYLSYEIIVVDNASSDGSVQCIREEFKKHEDKIVILPQQENPGIGRSNNIGANKARGKYILILNNDTEVDPSCLGELAAAMERDASIGAAQAKILLMNQRDTFDTAGSFLNVIGFPYTYGWNERDYGQYDRLYEILYAKGAAMIVRKNVWFNVEGYESLFSCYFEDTDFCWRVWLSGYRVVFVPLARVFHVSGATTSKLVRNLQFLRNLYFQDYRNKMVMVMKNLELKNLTKYTPWLLAMYAYYILERARKNDSAAVLGNIRGITWCLRFFRSIWTKRLKVQRMRVVRDETLFKKGIISKAIIFTALNFTSE